MELLIYGTTMCSKCKVAEVALSNQLGDKVTVRKVNVDDNPELITKLIDEGFNSFPVVEFDGKYYDGSANKLNEIIEIVKAKLEEDKNA